MNVNIAARQPPAERSRGEAAAIDRKGAAFYTSVMACHYGLRICLCARPSGPVRQGPRSPPAGSDSHRAAAGHTDPAGPEPQSRCSSCHDPLRRLRIRRTQQPSRRRRPAPTPLEAPPLINTPPRSDGSTMSPSDTPRATRSLRRETRTGQTRHHSQQPASVRIAAIMESPTRPAGHRTDQWQQGETTRSAI